MTPSRSRLATLTGVAVLALYVAVQAVGSLPALFFTPPGSGFFLVAVLSLLTSVPVALLILGHERRPLALGIAVAVQLIAALPIFGGLAPLVGAVAVYSLTRSRGARAGWLAAAGLTVAGLLGIGVGALIWPPAAETGIELSQRPVATVLTVAVLAVVATLVGALVSARTERLAALQENVRRAEAELEQRAELATVSERGRIAGELHDIVAHSLSVMVLLADGAATSSDPERAREAMRLVAETGRTALNDSRRALAVLGEDVAETAPLPDLAALPALIETVRAAGLPVTLDIAGEPIADEALQLTVYRIVQESLTNGLRHATGATAVTARIRSSATEVRIEVTDDGTAPAGSVRPDARGLIGMRERVLARGGTFSAGPVEPHGWRVTAALPAASR